MTRRRRRALPLRIPKTAHVASDRRVPVPGCGCATCVEARRARDLDAQHWDKVGALFGFADKRRGPSS